MAIAAAGDAAPLKRNRLIFGVPPATAIDIFV
jgi:hypothetical protein